MKKIVYKGSDYKFGRPVGYVNPEKFGQDDCYIYHDAELTKPFVKSEIFDFYINGGIAYINLDGGFAMAIPINYANDPEDENEAVLMFAFPHGDSFSNISVNAYIESAEE